MEFTSPKQKRRFHSRSKQDVYIPEAKKAFTSPNQKRRLHPWSKKDVYIPEDKKDVYIPEAKKDVYTPEAKKMFTSLKQKDVCIPEKKTFTSLKKRTFTSPKKKRLHFVRRLSWSATTSEKNQQLCIWLYWLCGTGFLPADSGETPKAARAVRGSSTYLSQLTRFDIFRSFLAVFHMPPFIWSVFEFLAAKLTQLFLLFLLFLVCCHMHKQLPFARQNFSTLLTTSVWPNVQV